MEIWEQAPIRVGIDLNRDKFLCWGSRPGDPLNLIPEPINIELLGFTPNSPVLLERSIAGIKVVMVDVTSGTGDGFTINPDGTTIPVSAGTVYSFRFLVRGLNGVNMNLTLSDQAATSLAGVGFVGSTDWQEVELLFTTDPGSTNLVVSVAKDGDATTGTLSVTGPMLVAGTSLPLFNTGTEVSLYEDISDYLETCDWQLGMSGPDERLCKEGEATLMLDNEERLFSPSYSGGPLFGYLEPGIHMSIELQDTDGTWVRKWTGFVEEINPHPTNRDRMADIKAIQGLTYITNRNTPAVRLYDAPTASDIIDILCVGLVPPDSLTWRLDVSRLDIETVLWSPDGNIEAVTGGTYTVFGEDWTTDDEDRKTRRYGTVRTLLEQLVEAEQGYMWLDAYGVFHFIDLLSVAALHVGGEHVSIDEEAGSAIYEYGNVAGIVNDIRVKAYPRQSVTGTLAFSNDEFSVTDGSSTTKKLSFEIDGKKYASESVSVNVSYASGSAGTVEASVEQESSNSATITLTNSSGGTADIVKIEVIGAGYSAGPESEVETYSIASMQKYRRKELEIDNRFIESETAAQSLAERVLANKAKARGRITGISIPANREEAWYSRMVNTEMMDGWFITEYQTGMDDWPGIILGQRYSWAPTHLQVQYVIGEGLGNIFWVLDISRLDLNTVLL